VFFSFFYTDIVFNADEVSENLKKSGAFVPGIRAGKSTADFIRYVLDRINVLGCFYLCVICILPGLLDSEFQFAILLWWYKFTDFSWRCD
jgi:preprotein translocase subunit SecY